MAGDLVIGYLADVSSPELSAQVRQLRALKLYRRLHKLCTTLGVGLADVLGPSRDQKVASVRVRAWGIAADRGVSVEDIALAWRAEVAVVRHALTMRQSATKAAVELVIPIHVDPSGWLRSRGILVGVQMICEQNDVTIEEAFGRSRRQRIVRARHAIWGWLRGRGWSYPDIAEPWDVDHTTVLYALRKDAA